ncbi:MAG: V-type ATP synthase subunit D, partial [Lactobacillales bacterium]|nr:V-type ATP synthase subunit D [Lactobacillales bacterium]
MARLNVKPTRMELASLKERLELSTRGHKLLKDKQDELMRRFIILIKKNNNLRDEVEAELIESMKEFVVAKSLINESFIEELFVGTETNVELSIQEKNVMSVIVPEMNFNVKEAEVSSDVQYGYLNSSSEMDDAIERIEDVLPKLLEL